jgi:F1F0 ATPase subunit 2
MHDVFSLILSLVAGIMLGAIFFGGLWWTIRQGVSSTQPALWFLVSLLLRTSIVLAGFYFISSGHWQRLLLSLLGFIIARPIVTYLLRLPKEASNAS